MPAERVYLERNVWLAVRSAHLFFVQVDFELETVGGVFGESVALLLSVTGNMPFCMGLKCAISPKLGAMFVRMPKSLLCRCIRVDESRRQAV